jgi:hypothetical protein
MAYRVAIVAERPIKEIAEEVTYILVNIMIEYNTRGLPLISALPSLSTSKYLDSMSALGILTLLKIA